MELNILSVGSKRVPLSFYDNCGKCKPILILLSQLHPERMPQDAGIKSITITQICYCILQHILTVDIQKDHHGICWSFKLSWIELFFIELGMKINGAYYCDMLLQRIVDTDAVVIEKIWGGNVSVSQQDSASAHHARDTWDVISFYAGFIFPDQWASDSHNLNPVNYKVWATCSSTPTRKKWNIEVLRQGLLNAWHSRELGHRYGHW